MKQIHKVWTSKQQLICLSYYRFSKQTSLISLSRWELLSANLRIRGDLLASWSRYGRLMLSECRVDIITLLEIKKKIILVFKNDA